MKQTTTRKKMQQEHFQCFHIRRQPRFARFPHLEQSLADAAPHSVQDCFRHHGDGLRKHWKCSSYSPAVLVRYPG